MSADTTPSAELLQANQRLHQLRRKARDARKVAGLPVDGSLRAPTAECPEGPNLVELVADLPQHLGWGSEAATAVLRRWQQKDGQAGRYRGWIKGLREAVTSPSAATDNPRHTLSRQSWVKLYPDIGLGMLRQELAAPGRLWLLMRYLDEEGSGVLRIDILTTHLTEKTSALHLCGKRQLRNLLRDGEGVYWTRDKERVWLRSAAKVAYALGVERLTGRPVALPVTAVLDGIGTFRAHLYAAFHSGRVKDTPHGERAMPIARETMTELSGVGQSSQRAYEERVGVEVQANFAVGNISTKENQENRAWEKGWALFELKDYRGQQGKKGKTYLAWQLPNTYVGQHQHRPLGRQKRINRELKDLVMKGMPGNVGETNETGVPSGTQKPEKVYYPNGKLAAKAYGRDPERELYWRRHGTKNGRFDLWQQLGGG